MKLAYFDNLRTLVESFLTTIDVNEFRLIRNHKEGDQSAALLENIAQAIRRAAIMLAYKHEFNPNIDAVKVELEPAAWRYCITTFSTSRGAFPEAYKNTLGTFKIDGGKQSGRVYSFEFTIDDIE